MSPFRFFTFFLMIATAFLSMWVSNTATTLMMLPIGISVLALVVESATTGREPVADPGLGAVRADVVILVLVVALPGDRGHVVRFLVRTRRLTRQLHFAPVLHGFRARFARGQFLGLFGVFLGFLLGQLADQEFE